MCAIYAKRTPHGGPSEFGPRQEIEGEGSRIFFIFLDAVRRLEEIHVRADPVAEIEEATKALDFEYRARTEEGQEFSGTVAQK